MGSVLSTRNRLPMRPSAQPSSMTARLINSRSGPERNLVFVHEGYEESVLAKQVIQQLSWIRIGTV
jgi:hypothetical protein